MNTSLRHFWLTIGGAFLAGMVPASINTFIPALLHWFGWLA